jgi:hypothetical protein
VVETGGLENRQRGDSLGGSNPSSSASIASINVVRHDGATWSTE